MREEDVARKLQQIDEQLAAQTPAEVDRSIMEKIVSPIADENVERILALPRTPLTTTGVTGSVYLCEGGDYIVKEMLLGERIPQEEWLKEMATSEVVKADLCRQLGIPTPGLNVKLHWNGNRCEKVSMIYRAVHLPGDGGLAKTLDKLTQGEIYLYRDALSRERAVSIWVGDFDRKADNFLVLGKDAVTIDGGVGDVTGTRAKVNDKPVDSPITMEGYWGMDHWWVKAPDLNWDGKGADPAKILAAEEAVMYGRAKPMIEKIEQMVGDPERIEQLRNRLKACYEQIYRDCPPDLSEMQNLVNPTREGLIEKRAHDSLELLKKRAKRLDEAMRKLNWRTGIPNPPVQTGCLTPAKPVLLCHKSRRCAYGPASFAARMAA
jgi:hypothetical protein